MRVKDRAAAVGAYRHVNVTLMETLARWVPTTPEMEVKVLFGRHLWLFAQLADRLGRRARELRAPLHYSRDPEAAFAEALAALASLEPTADRLAGFYAGALPAMARAYEDYLARTDDVLDEPTVVILRDGLRDLEKMREDRARLERDVASLHGPGEGAATVSRRFAREVPVRLEGESAAA